MQHFRNDTPKKSLSLILSILFHLLLLLFLLYLRWQQPQREGVVPAESREAVPEEALSSTDIAALKTRASEFGAPVIFQEEPTFTPPDAPAQEPAPAPEQQARAEKAPEQPITHQQQPEVKPEPTRESTAFIAEPTTQKEPISFQPTQQPLPEAPPQPKPAEKKKPSFADLAQGFIQTLKDQGGQDLFERKGNENLRPDMEELKIISYQEKVIWFMQNSFRAHSSEEPGPLEPLLLCPTLLTLNQDGSIVELRLVQSSGSPAFDAFYLKVIRNAAPFPPVPSHIQTPFTFRFTGQHYTERRPAGVQRKKPAGLSMR